MPDLLWAACWLALLLIALVWHFLDRRRREQQFDRAVTDLELDCHGRDRL